MNKIVFTIYVCVCARARVYVQGKVDNLGADGMMMMIMMNSSMT
jgi:hypothetical protein